MCGSVSPNGFVPSGTPSALGNNNTTGSTCSAGGAITSSAIPWMGTYGPLMMVVLWAVIVYAIVMLVRHFTTSSSEKGKPMLLEILKERYASGEIDKKEFEEKKKELEI